MNHSTERYRRYVLAILTLTYTLNFLDRGLIALVLQPIQAELQLSDTQLGFLTGIAFGLFYSTLGLPIARWADRGNRSTIASVAIGLWGLTVMSTVWVTNYFQLVLARIAAAIGEAGCAPPTYSLVGDYFPKAAERARAMAIYWLANPLASLMSFIAGGWLNDQYGWRITLFVMGIPALVVAVLIKLTVAEPRTAVVSAGAREQRLPPMSIVLKMLWSQHSSRHLIIGIVLLFTMGLGLSPWYAAFMMRSHGMATTELGIWLGLIFGLGGMGGILLSGYIAGRLPDAAGRQLRLSALAVALLVPCFCAFLLLSNKYLALLALLPLAAAFNFILAPTFALMQRLVADDMRATTLAVVMLLANLIGMGLGPQVVGVLSDGLRPHFGPDALRYAMLIVTLIALWAAWHFWRAGRTVEVDLDNATRYS